MVKIIIENAKITLLNGSNINGPVTADNGEEFLFRNTFSDLDLWFTLRRDGNNEWYFSGGPSIQIPNQYVLQIGEQIDKVETVSTWVKHVYSLV